jgi:hypothetical protein
MPIGRTLRAFLYVGAGALAAVVPLMGPDPAVDPATLPFGEQVTESTSLDPVDSSPVTSRPVVTVPTTIVGSAIPAVLTVNAPERSDRRVIQLDGWANAGTRVFTLDREVEVAENGLWTTEVSLVPGLNTVIFETIGPDGQIRRRSVDVFYDADDSPVAAVEFSAVQLYKGSVEVEPYEYFSGTATPLSTVTISSPYGVATTLVDEDGNWSLAIFFSALGGPDQFPIIVTAGNGSAEFDFVYSPPPDVGTA